MKQNDKYIAQDILDAAKAVINTLDKEKEFKLKDLFRAIDWDDFPKKERLAAGTIFRNNVDAKMYSVEYTGKTSSNAAVYKKI